MPRRPMPEDQVERPSVELVGLVEERALMELVVEVDTPAAAVLVSVEVEVVDLVPAQPPKVVLVVEVEV